jgi:hypothetical protein
MGWERVGEAGGGVRLTISNFQDRQTFAFHNDRFTLRYFQEFTRERSKFLTSLFTRGQGNTMSSKYKH